MDRLEPPAPDIEERADHRAASRRIGLWLIGLGLLVALVVVAIGTRQSSKSDTMSPAEVGSAVKAAVDESLEEARAAAPDSALVYQAILPSLVFIQAEREGGAGGESGLGTGVVINADGAILTARHVVADADGIRVTFADGTQATAQIVSEEPENDIAVLGTDRSPEVIVPAVMGSTGGLQVGDNAYAVGHPLGLVGSLSAGVISGLDRSIPVNDGASMQGLIQFDAAVNPGSSGGPLLNRSGQVIGIVTALANPSKQGYFIGIGFAVPIGTASGAAGGPTQ